MNNLLKAIGVEIEGGWNDVSKVLKYFHSDWSTPIEGFKNIEHILPYGDYHVDNYIIERVQKEISYPVHGEVASEPLPNLREVYRWVNKVHPQGFARTCGIHVHTSFHNLTQYAKIMTPHFYNLMIERMEEFGKKEVNGKDGAEENFWHRWSGKNLEYAARRFEYCTDYNQRKNNLIHYGAFVRGGNYGKFRHQTFEFRLLPSFEKAATTRKGISAYLKTIKECLTKNQPPKEEWEKSLGILKGVAPEIPV